MAQIGRLETDELVDLYRMNVEETGARHAEMAEYLGDELRRRQQAPAAAGPTVMSERHGPTARDVVGYHQSAAPHQAAPSEAPSRGLPSQGVPFRVEALQATPHQTAPSEIAFRATPARAASLRPLAPATPESRAASTTPGAGAAGTPPIGRAARENLPRGERPAPGGHSATDKRVIDRVLHQQKLRPRSGPTM
ncbi:hypothetical protein GCM10009863_13260 [Streptomyces axinellae]|uniref:Uncharacterized protein n=1 Tax=Streptomyces axinellae TaxID=552788 RepID=A0ABP6C5A8_9ACTN